MLMMFGEDREIDSVQDWCLCISSAEREERQTDRRTDGQTETDRDRVRERERERE